MNRGKAYKLAALAAAHKTRAIILLKNGDHEGARKEEVAFLDRIEYIPGRLRQEIGPFLDASVQIKLNTVGMERNSRQGLVK